MRMVGFGFCCRDWADGCVRGDGICDHVRVCRGARGAAYDGWSTASDCFHGGDIDGRGSVFLAGGNGRRRRRRNCDTARAETAGRRGGSDCIDGRRQEAGCYSLINNRGLVHNLIGASVRQGIGKGHGKGSANSKE